MKISVIIPVLNESDHLLSCIASIQGQEGEHEIFVVDCGSTDGTVEIAKPHATVIQSKRGRAIQMNAGASSSNGDLLLFLHADCQLPSGAFHHMEGLMKHPRTMGGTFTLRFDTSGTLLELIAFFTRFRFRYFHYGDQGIFVRRKVFEALGGFREIPLMEDAEFLQRLRRKGRVGLIKEPVTTSARRFLENGIVHQQLLNTVLVILFRLGMNPRTLSRWYR